MLQFVFLILHTCTCTEHGRAVSMYVGSGAAHAGWDLHTYIHSSAMVPGFRMGGSDDWDGGGSLMDGLSEGHGGAVLGEVARGFVWILDP